MPKLIGKSTTVVEIEGLQINELAGNVATSEDTLSIAYVTVSQPTSEPWLTLDYDEWICVRKGTCVFQFVKDDGTEGTLEVSEGQTCFIAKGERFRPCFPTAPVEYIPVCSPAFKPERCKREEGEEASNVTIKLRQLHGQDNEEEDQAPMCKPTDATNPDILYHMCEKALWDKAVQSKKAYYPPTFKVDGNFTHATAVPTRLVETANHFYTASKGDWICLELSRSALMDVGIITIDEEGLPVGEQAVSNDWVEGKWICPHIYGGIPTLEGLGVLKKTYPMIRTDDGKFVNIQGLTE